MAARILLIEDDQQISDLLSTLLEKEGFETVRRFDGLSGEEEALRRPFDVIILDIMLPQKNGLDVLRDLRGKIATPILMLTARGDDIDRIIGFEIGADDYLPKPFNPRELIARLHALLRRVKIDKQAQEKREDFAIGALTINHLSREVYYLDRPIELTSTEFNILTELAANLNGVSSKQTLTESVLGRKLSLHDRAIDMHMSNLRKKIPELPIKTVRGVGYILSHSASKNL